MAIECPHCFTFVHVRADGLCPACHEDPNDLRGIDRDRATVMIGENSPIPDVCCDCGLPARRRVIVEEWKPIAGDRASISAGAETGALRLIFQVFLGWLGAPILKALVDHGAHTRHAVRVAIVQCNACAANGRPRPVRVDFEHFAMRFVVHNRFRICLEELVRDDGS